jgi:putative phage-type endonuclease
MDVLKYFTNCSILSTVSQEEDEKEWLANRTKGIGGSDVGAICGVNKYSSARLIYLKKTGQYQDSEDEFSDAALERMHFGRMLEPIVANEYVRRTGNKVIVSPATLSHKDYPWAIANVDRLIVDDKGVPYGILECKTASEYMDEAWSEGDVPLSYLYQLNWYLWVTGLEYGVIACLVGGNKFYHYEVWRNDELLKDEIFPKVDKFWNYHVKNLIEPELSGTDADSESVANEYSEVIKGSEIVLEDETMNELAAIVKECKAKIKELEATEKEATNRLKDALKNNEIGYTKDYIIKWSPRSQSRIDIEKLKKKYPAVYADCVKQINFRVFTVK